jgi:hypothetical protein
LDLYRVLTKEKKLQRNNIKENDLELLGVANCEKVNTLGKLIENKGYF